MEGAPQQPPANPPVDADGDPLPVQQPGQSNEAYQAEIKRLADVKKRRKEYVFYNTWSLFDYEHHIC